MRASVESEFARSSIVSLSSIFESKFWRRFLLPVNGHVFVETYPDFSFFGRPTWDLSEDMQEYLCSLAEKRVSVLIGNHLPIGVAETKRESVPIGSQLICTSQMMRGRLRHGSHRCFGSEE